MAYTKINWENLPSTNTPVNADNLNHMDQGIYDANEKNIITAGITNNVTISTGGSNNINLNRTIASVGSKLTLSNGKIVIGAGVNHILISGQWNMYIQTGNGDAKNFYVQKNSSNIITGLNTIVRTVAVNATRGIGNLLIGVEPGDTISYQVYGGVNDSVTAAGNYLTVEVID